MALLDHIQKRLDSGVYEYRRRVPKSVAHLDARREVKRSLKTTDERIATERARVVDAAQEQLWASLLEGQQATSSFDRYNAAVRIALLHGFKYRAPTSFGEAEVEEVIRRLSAAKGQPAIVAQSILGLVPPPTPMLKQLWELYERHNAGGFDGMSANQLRKHKTPRLRAVAYAVAYMGEDKELGAITRDDVLGFRGWWMEKVQKEGLRADTLNRCFTDIKGMLTVVDGALQTHYCDVWKATRVKPTNKTKSVKRAVYELDFIQDQVLQPGRLDGMNLEARVSVYLIIETGARPSEICNLRRQDIHLDVPIPYIDIDEREDRRRKSDNAFRQIPLVGCALWAMKQLPGGFVHYADKEDLLSKTVNSFLLENGLRPTRRHTFYSIRHLFQDRILASNAPDRVQTDLMGHEFVDREAYGEGASLKQKHELLEGIKFRWIAPS